MQTFCKTSGHSIWQTPHKGNTWHPIRGAHEIAISGGTAWSRPDSRQNNTTEKSKTCFSREMCVPCGTHICFKNKQPCCTPLLIQLQKCCVHQKVAYKNHTNTHLNSKKRQVGNMNLDLSCLPPDKNGRIKHLTYCKQNNEPRGKGGGQVLAPTPTPTRATDTRVLSFYHITGSQGHTTTLQGPYNKSHRSSVPSWLAVARRVLSGENARRGSPARVCP